MTGHATNMPQTNSGGRSFSAWYGTLRNPLDAEVTTLGEGVGGNGTSGVGNGSDFSDNKGSTSFNQSESETKRSARVFPLRLFGKSNAKWSATLSKAPSSNVPAIVRSLVSRVLAFVNEDEVPN